jgi:hypothetical protein
MKPYLLGLLFLALVGGQAGLKVAVCGLLLLLVGVL